VSEATPQSEKRELSRGESSRGGSWGKKDVSGLGQRGGEKKNIKRIRRLEEKKICNSPTQKGEKSSGPVVTRAKERERVSKKK